MDWVLGLEHESIESLAAGWRSVTASDVAAFGRDVQRDALFALPGGAKLRQVMGKQVPPSTARVVEGREILPIDAPLQTVRLVHGSDGVSLRWADGSHRTVHYADLGAALSYEDGLVHLIGVDATGISVEPTLWRDGPRVCREIRERVPAGLLLDQGTRPADAIPKPYSTGWQRLRARLINGWQWLHTRLTTSWQWLRTRLLPHWRLLALIGAAVLVVLVVLSSPGAARSRAVACTIVYLLAFALANSRWSGSAP
jgi:hypothetical protein